MMNYYRVTTLLLACGLAAAACHGVHAQTRHPQSVAVTTKGISKFRSINTAEIQTLLADTAQKNPKVAAELSADASMRKAQLESLKDLLALASQAEKDGIADEPANKQELENIRAEISAVNYDREINKVKGPPFSNIPPTRVTKFWAVPIHQADFDRFIDSKIAIIKAANPDFTTVAKEERDQARDMFAKTQISAADYETARRQRRVSKGLISRIDLNVKLQQAQFLARAYTDKNAAKMHATDLEVAAYIAAHSEFDPAAKRLAAQKILDRAKAGEDFAKLADQFSEDPGNKRQDGTPQGGLYKNVPMGMMVKPFETAALALNAGQISPELVESDFGYHVIKLERKSESDYDVRHILISTTVADPANPNGRELPVKEYVRSLIETEKGQKFIDGLAAANNISVPADFTVPSPSVVKESVPLKGRVKNKR